MQVARLATGGAPSMRDPAAMIPFYSHHEVVTGSAILVGGFALVLAALLARWWLRR
jgi:hypothetical protein